MDNIPLKLHADDQHPLASRIRVWVDDVEQKGVIEYDAFENYAVVLVIDENGNSSFDPEREEFVTKRVEGAVILSLRDQ